MMLICADLGLGPFVDLEHDIDAVLVELTILGSTVAAKRPWRLYSSMMRATSGADLGAGEDLARRELDLR